MRKLATKDLFAAMRIIKISGVKNELMPIIKAADGEDVEGVGILGVLTVLEALSGTAAEKELYKCIADIAETEEHAIAEMPIADFLGILKQIAAENDMESFFADVQRLNG